MTNEEPLDPEDIIAAIRANMLMEAEAIPMPAFLKTRQDVNDPLVIHIHDVFTDRRTTVPLYAYKAFRQALSDLYGIQL